MSSCLQNNACDVYWTEVSGVLLYPAVAHQFRWSFNILGHEIRIESIDLNNSWPEIHEQLLGILIPDTMAEHLTQQY